MLLVMGCYFVLVQVNRSAGGVLASYLATVRGLSATDIGTVMGSMFFASALIQLPTGILFDWIGPRRTLVRMGLVALAGLLIFALAGDRWGLIAGRFAIGLGHAGVITAVYLIAMAWAPPDRTAQATAAVVGVAGGIGGILATAPLALALEAYGLSVTYLAIAAATAGLTLMLHLTLQDRPADLAGAPPRSTETLRQMATGLLEVMRMPELRRIFVMGSCFTAPFLTIGGLWAGPYFVDIQRLDAASASYVLLGLVIALHLGTFLYGPLERLARSRKRLILAGAGIEIAALSILVIWPGVPLAIAVATLFVFGCAAPFFVVLAAHARAFVPAGRAGRAITCINLSGLTGVFVLQGGTGALLDIVLAAGGTPETGYRLVFLTVIVFLAVASAIFMRQPEAPDRGQV